MAAKKASKAKAKSKAKAQAKRGQAKPPKRDPARGKKSGQSQRLSAAKQSLRDSMMLTRANQGFTHGEIAAEFGISRSAVERAIKKKREAKEPLLEQDMVKMVEGMIEELHSSVGDFEKIAVAAVGSDQLAVAVGSKRAANEAREKLRELLQSVGAIPHDLGTVTHVIDVRAVVLEINETVEGLVSSIERMKMPKAQKAKVVRAARKVSSRLDEIGAAPQQIGSGNGSGPDEEEDSDG